MSMKNSSDTIGNRNRNLPACSTVPQPTAPPRAPQRGVSCTINTEHSVGKRTRNVVRLVGEHEWHCAVGYGRRWNELENEERAGVWQLIEC